METLIGSKIDEDIINSDLRVIDFKISKILTRWQVQTVDQLVTGAKTGQWEEAESDAIEIQNLVYKQKYYEIALVLREFIIKARKLISFELEEVHIFGSFVRGELEKDSDIDILVIVGTNTIINRRKLLGIAYDILLEKNLFFSVKVLSRSEYVNLVNINSSFIKKVLEEGFLIE
jgi:predicted nucleotidyltransferase